MKIYFNRFIKVEMRGLKCDAKGCDYADDTIHKNDSEMYVNTPCPECGANLFTEADLKVCKFLLRLEKLFGWIKIPSFRPSKRREFLMDGSGKITIKKEVINSE